MKIIDCWHIENMTVIKLSQEPPFGGMHAPLRRGFFMPKSAKRHPLYLLLAWDSEKNPPIPRREARKQT
jgi:hypothetical protein